MVQKKFDGEILSIKDTIDVLEAIEKDKNFVKPTFITGIQQQFPFGIWFRGQSDTEYKLQPTIFREKITKTFIKKDLETKFYNETSIFIHSKLRLANLLKDYQSSFDWLCLMQHYEVPTRILDWSESILVALYFAVRNSLEKESDAELIVLNARALNNHVREKYMIATPDTFDTTIRSEMTHHKMVSRLLSDKNVIEKAAEERIDIQKIEDKYIKPISIFPYRLNERMVFQSSVFTLHGGKKYFENEIIYENDRIPDTISLEEVNKEINILKFYKIPNHAKSDIEKNLFMIGIHEGTLFPELDRQSIYLKQLW